MSYYDDQCDFSVLVGKTLTKVDQSDEQIDFHCSDGSSFRQYHIQSCCENVSVDDVIGSWDDIIGSPIVVADENSNSDLPAKSEHAESFTWTFYKLDTAKGGVTIRWYGSSNGYYSESVSFERLTVSETSQR